MADNVVVKADATLNLTGLTCPGPIIGAKRMVDDMQAGQVLLLVSDCPGTRDDLYAWANSTGNRVLKEEKQGEGAMGFYIQRGTTQHVDAQVTLDMRGSVCPGPIIEAKRVIEGMKSGEVMRLISNCPGSRDDVQGWAKTTGLTLEEVVALGTHEFEFFIRKP
jgi:TusA-related sulfurtransferase